MGKRILFVSQDQGSGNALAPVIKKITNKGDFTIRVFASKYSKEIFRDLDIAFTDLDGGIFENAVDYKPGLIVTGASMRHSIEKDAIIYARQHSIRSITILDFWGNYWQRFTIDGKRDLDSLPDFILLPDPIAKKQMVNQGFPADKLIVTGNPYFDTFKIQENKNGNSPEQSILIIAQPLFKDEQYLTDHRFIDDCLRAVTMIEEDISIRLRPHPKENPKEYLKYVNQYVKIEMKRDIGELVEDSRIIIGKYSTVLFESVFLGKIVISYNRSEESHDALITNRLGLSFPVNSPRDLKHLLKRALKGELKVNIPKTIKYYNDGRCANRVVDFILINIYSRE